MEGPDKMSKSGGTVPTIGEISAEVRMEALKSEAIYWRTRYELLLKYGSKAEHTQQPGGQHDMAIVAGPPGVPHDLGGPGM